MKSKPYRSKRQNLYITYLERLERECPDIMSELDNEIYERDTGEECTEEEARAHAALLVATWITDLQRIRETLINQVERPQPKVK